MNLGWVGQIWINETQYWEHIPQVMWNTGGYQPAQKWLNSRKGYSLRGADILYYSKIIHALSETHKWRIPQRCCFLEIINIFF